jgi:hypothetical protein
MVLQPTTWVGRLEVPGAGLKAGGSEVPPEVGQTSIKTHFGFDHTSALVPRRNFFCFAEKAKMITFPITMLSSSITSIHLLSTHAFRQIDISRALVSNFSGDT